jgi:hypothetical protein
VQRIVRAYEDHKQRLEKAQQLSLLPEAHPAEPLLGESATPVLEQ